MKSISEINNASKSSMMKTLRKTVEMTRRQVHTSLRAKEIMEVPVEEKGEKEGGQNQLVQEIREGSLALRLKMKIQTTQLIKTSHSMSIPLSLIS